MCGCESSRSSCGCPDQMIDSMFAPSMGPRPSRVRAGGANCPSYMRGVQGLVASSDGRLYPWAAVYQQIESVLSPLLLLVGGGVIVAGPLGAGSVVIDLIATCDPGETFARSGGRLASSLRVQATVVGIAGGIAVFVAPPAAPICGAVAAIMLALASVVESLARGQAPSLSSLTSAIDPLLDLMDVGGVDTGELGKLARNNEVRDAARAAAGGASSSSSSSSEPVPTLAEVQAFLNSHIITNEPAASSGTARGLFRTYAQKSFDQIPVFDFNMANNLSNTQTRVYLAKVIKCVTTAAQTMPNTWDAAIARAIVADPTAALSFIEQGQRPPSARVPVGDSGGGGGGLFVPLVVAGVAAKILGFF